ncbi:MAG: hypothetical protein WKF83_14220 [Nocardioidaceae bacterium]
MATREGTAALPIPSRVEETELGAIEDLLTSAKSKAEGTVMPTMVVGAALRVLRPVGHGLGG